MILLEIKKFKPIKAECKNCKDKLTARYKEFISCKCFKIWHELLSNLRSNKEITEGLYKVFCKQAHGIYIDGGDGYYHRQGGNPEDFNNEKTKSGRKKINSKK